MILNNSGNKIASSGVRVTNMTRIFCSFLFFSSTVLAQTAVIDGIVRDEFGYVVPDAAVTLFSHQVLIAETRTDESGTYQFAEVTPGDYRVGVVKLGFLISNGVAAEALEASERRGLDVTLQRERREGSRPVPRRIFVDWETHGNRLRRVVMPAAAGLTGSVALHLIVNEEGEPSAFVDDGSQDPRLVKPAIAAAEQWRFTTTALNGVPVQVETIVRLRFDSANVVIEEK